MVAGNPSRSVGRRRGGAASCLPRCPGDLDPGGRGRIQRAMLASVPTARRRQGAIAGALILAVLSACTGKKPLEYKPPDSRLKAGGIVFACEPAEDQRRNSTIDALLEAPPARSLDVAVQGEIAASGFAEQVVVLSGAAQPTMDELRGRGIRILVEPALEVMDWGVPGSDGKQEMTTAFRLLHAATPTEVEARTVFSVRMYNLSTKQYVTKTYRGSAKKRMLLLGSDTSAEVSRLAGQSLQLALHPFWSDLAEFVRQP